MAGLGDLLVSIRASASEFSSDMKAIQREVKQTESVLKPIQQQAAAIGTALAATGLAAGAALIGMTKQAADYGDAIRDASIRTGIGTKELSVYKLAAEQSGSSLEELSGGLKIMAKNIEAASQGTDKQQRLFKDLGVSVKDADGKTRPFNDILKDVSNKFATMPEGVGKTALSLELMGKNGAASIEFLSLGAAGIDEFTAKAEKFGTVISADVAAKSDAFNDSLNDMKQAMLGLSLVVGEALMPSLTTLAITVADAIAGFTQFAGAHPQLIEAIAKLAGIIAGAGGLLLGLSGVLLILPKLQAAWLTLNLAFAANPIGLVIIGITALVAGLIAFRNEIAGGVAKAWSLLLAGVGAVVGALGTAAKALGLSGIGGALTKASDWIKDTSANLADMSKVLLAGEPTIAKATAAVKTQGVELERTGKAVKGVSDQVKAAAQAHTEWVSAMDRAAASLQAFYEKMKQASADFANSQVGIFEDAAKRAKDASERLAKESLAAWTLASAQMNAVWDADRQADIASIAALGGAASNTIDQMRDDAKKAGVAVAATANTMAASFNTAIGNLTSGFAKGVTDMIFQGKNLKDSLVGLLKSTAESMLGSLISGFITPAMNALGKIGGNLASVLTGGGGAGGVGGLAGIFGGTGGLAGIFGGGAAAGGAAGAGAGAAGAGAGAGGGGMAGLGALMTNPWTIGIAGAIAAGIAIVKSQAHHEANQFVKEFENPFGDMLSDLVDSFNDAHRAGKLTKDAATTAIDETQKLWTEFQRVAEEFAKGGSDEAKVVSQAFSHLKPLMKQIFADMGITLDSIAEAAGTVMDDAATATTDYGSSLDDLLNSTNAAIDPVRQLANAIDGLRASALSVSSGGGSTGGEGRLPTLTTPGGLQLANGVIRNAFPIDAAGNRDLLREAMGTTVNNYVTIDGVVGNADEVARRVYVTITRLFGAEGWPGLESR